MSKKDVLKILDLLCYVIVIMGTILIVIFEFTGVFLALKSSVILFTFATVSLIALNICRFVFSILSKDRHDDFYLEKKSKIFLIIKIVLFLALLIWLIYMMVNFN